MITDPLTVSIDGHLDPVTLPPPEALDVLWQALCELPPDELQLWGLGRLFAGGTEELERRMNGDAITDVTVALPDGTTVIVRVSYGDGLTCRQRVALRHVPERVTALGLPEVWVLRDSRTGGLATEVGRPVRCHSESAAREWIRRQVQNATYQAGPRRADR